ncbi:MAG: preprotein translocase subunit SecE [Acetobacteraceae bacterium]|nr:preprotein translocase subunit SecE [Acetobacteraceae bacterium]
MPGRRRILARLAGFLREVRAELKKVVWPTRKETVVFTSVVIVSVIIVATAIWVIDGVFSQVLKLILR